MITPNPFRNILLNPFSTFPDASSSSSSSLHLASPLLSPARRFTLIFLLDSSVPTLPRVLLGLKLRGFGKGLYNGFGGKLELGESIRGCAIREVAEECGVIIDDSDLAYAGDLFVTRSPRSDGGGGKGETVHITIYTCLTWSGNPKASEEMQPSWFTLSQVPYDQMWPEARAYLAPLVKVALETSTRRALRGRVHYDASGSPSWWLAFEESKNGVDLEQIQY